MYRYVDYKEKYGRIMQFGKNKKVPIHRWYPFVEGYSREFIESIIDEQEEKPKVCLEPFSGSGTTALELQRLGIKCHSFEVNPFMYKLSQVKVKFPKYKCESIYMHMEKMVFTIRVLKDKDIKVTSEFRTMLQGEHKKKWNLDKQVFIAIEKIKIAINEINDPMYEDLYQIALASILLDVSNLYRNGKCLSYKKNWENIKLTQNDVFEKFFRALNDIFIEDINNAKSWSEKITIDNSLFLREGDSRKLINSLEDNSVDLVITSPPYLNSRDYTDSYMLELKVLDFTKNLNEIRDLRKQTIRSHVQLKWSEKLEIDNVQLNKILENINEKITVTDQWNIEIPNMILAYFVDIKEIFESIYDKLKLNGMVYFNVSNSAYYNIMVDTLGISAKLAEDVGFEVIEIREARLLNSSPQQKKTIGKLLEGIIVLKKTSKV